MIPGGNGFILEGVRQLGSVAIFLVRLLGECVPALRRPRLIVHQVYNSGARSHRVEVFGETSAGEVPVRERSRVSPRGHQ